ncbi:TetR/AcrR family transcriptional regulator [Kiloniella laminariae]|uniref:TetR/AcrR family transcriptional regulator n=1 Tax=Kiloniella laminariae TaxID=454162 RepID=UPI000371FC8C|nr:TetR family transcriptional regulator C-terminal domain-containing protein [Kiloniella laminariae]
MQQAQEKKRPGRPRGRQTENTSRRRRQLIEAAIDSIVEHGMSATTLATVAKSAGLSQGAAVFYFQTKENLLVETLRYHYQEYQDLWQEELEKAPDDPVEKITALVLADLDPKICNPRNLTLWNSFWGEVTARPRFAKLCDDFDRERYSIILRLCEDAAPLIRDHVWSPASVADTLDTMVDGLWVRMHITPDFLDNKASSLLMVRLLISIFPTRSEQIMARQESKSPV